jgi:hypothetical protein
MKISEAILRPGLVFEYNNCTTYYNNCTTYKVLGNYSGDGFWGAPAPGATVILIASTQAPPFSVKIGDTFKYLLINFRDDLINGRIKILIHYPSNGFVKALKKWKELNVK